MLSALIEIGQQAYASGAIIRSFDIKWEYPEHKACIRGYVSVYNTNDGSRSFLINFYIRSLGSDNWIEIDKVGPVSIIPYDTRSISAVHPWCVSTNAPSGWYDVGVVVYDAQGKTEEPLTQKVEKDAFKIERAKAISIEKISTTKMSSDSTLITNLHLALPRGTLPDNPFYVSGVLYNKQNTFRLPVEEVNVSSNPSYSTAEYSFTVSYDIPEDVYMLKIELWAHADKSGGSIIPYGKIDEHEQVIAIGKELSGESYNVEEVVIDNQTFLIQYAISNASIDIVNTEKTTKSIVVAATSSGNGLLEIKLPRELIDCKLLNEKDCGFAVTVNNNEVNHEETFSDYQYRTIKIPLDFSSGDKLTIRITGTYIVPEFPMPLAVFLMLAMVVILSRIKNSLY